MSAATRAKIRTKAAIRDYEEEMGIQVAGNARLEEMFRYLHQVYLAAAKLAEMKYRRELPIA